MSIKIIRNTGWAGWYLGIKIILNGENINTIEEMESLEIELPVDNSYLKVRQLGVKSNKIMVRDGDKLEIKTTWWYQIIIPVMIIIQLLSLLITFVDNRFSILFSLSTFIIIISLFIIMIISNNGFHIKIISRK